MGRKEMQSLFSLITAAVFFTAAFFTGRQAAVLTGKFRVEREQSRQSRTKYCVVVDAGHGGDDPGKSAQPELWKKKSIWRLRSGWKHC